MSGCWFGKRNNTIVIYPLSFSKHSILVVGALLCLSPHHISMPISQCAPNSLNTTKFPIAEQLVDFNLGYPQACRQRAISNYSADT